MKVVSDVLIILEIAALYTLSVKVVSDIAALYTLSVKVVSDVLIILSKVGNSGSIHSFSEGGK